MATTKIEWATKVWNPVTGCDKVSAGCQNCYAERFANRLKFNPKLQGKYSEGFRVQMHPNELVTPVKWQKPERIFVCSMGDLFHEDVTFEFIRKILGTIYIKPTHTFLVLTKRPQRMYDFFQWLGNSNLKVNFKNLWLGATVENQEQANKRIPILLSIPASIRFVSCEPLLSDIDFYGLCPKLDWVIAGGETGPKSRPANPGWFESLQKQCKTSNTPFFFKGWGDWIDIHNGYDVINGRYPFNFKTETLGSGWFSIDMHKVGKKYAGRLLNDKEYNEFPTL